MKVTILVLACSGSLLHPAERSLSQAASPEHQLWRTSCARATAHTGKHGRGTTCCLPAAQTYPQVSTVTETKCLSGPALSPRQAAGVSTASRGAAGSPAPVQSGHASSGGCSRTISVNTLEGPLLTARHPCGALPGGVGDHTRAKEGLGSTRLPVWRPQGPRLPVGRAPDSHSARAQRAVVTCSPLGLRHWT